MEISTSSQSSSWQSSSSWSPSSLLSSVSFARFWFLVGLVVNIVSWYITNGMYGVCMQSFSTIIKKLFSPSPSLSSSSSSLPLVASMAIMSTVTCMQLFCGVVLGFAVLVSLRLYNHHHHRKQTHHKGHDISICSFSTINDLLSLLVSSLSMFISTFSFNKFVLGCLHGTGSTFTNLGYLYGSASIVQIIKLLEPFETLLLSHFLLPLPPGKKPLLHQPSIIASMILVVGGAISLIQNRKKLTHTLSILYAILSGFVLSTRNVVQRKQLNGQKNSNVDNKSNNSDGDSPNVISDENNIQNKQQQIQHQQQIDSSNSISNSSKLENSVLLFTQLSLYGGVFLAAISSLLWNFSLGALFNTGSETAVDSYNFETILLHNVDSNVLIYHPLYNIFSMVTLGYVTALTHSLLNAGKRVFSILVAILYFGEDFTIYTVFSLCIIGVGGYWYAMEAKN